MVDEKSEDSCTNHKNFYSDGVQITTYGSPVLDKDKEYVGDGAEDEEDLDGSVVEGDEVCEDIQVAGDEHK